MRKSLFRGALLLTCLLGAADGYAQLSSNPVKFLGNITTNYQMDTDGFIYADLWNQVTPENETKWGSIEGTRDSYNWGGADNAYNYAKKYGFPFKFHCLVWGSQYPNWITSLSNQEAYEEIDEWMREASKRYPDLPLIDVVNEAVPGHAPAPYKNALGGDGVTGYDWIVKAFEMAHKYWPNAILIYNDYNTFQWNTDAFIELVQTLIDAGAPIDAYGCQSHDLTDMKLADFKTVMKKLQDALHLPMYSTEYDIGTTDDNKQKQQYKDQISFMWECDYCAGITLWGYIYGKTWIDDGISGIIRNGKDRPAMTWLREYMASDKAKNAGFRKNFPLENGWTKEANIYVRPTTTKASIGDTLNIDVRARMRTKTIERVELYMNDKLVDTMTEPLTLVGETEPIYRSRYIPSALGKVTFKAIVYTTDGGQYTRYSHVTTYKQRAPYKGVVTQIPGTIKAVDFDSGADGIAFHDSDSRNEGTSAYRTDGAGVDIVNGNGSYVIGYTAVGEWLEYTVDVNTAGRYLYSAVASSGTDGSGFSVSVHKDGELKTLANIAVPKTGDGNWDNYRTIEGSCLMELEKGRQIIRITVTGASCNIDKVTLTPVEITDRVRLEVKAEPEEVYSGEPVVLKAIPTILPDTIQTASGTKIETVKIKSVSIYVNNSLVATKTSAPYQVTFENTIAPGTYVVKAMAVDSKRRETPFFEGSFNVKVPRTQFKYGMAFPGTLQFEDFDCQGEGLTFHDIDSFDEGGHMYRIDNEGLDILTAGNGYCVGVTAAGEWMEYTVNVKSGDNYKFDAKVRGLVAGSSFSIELNDDGTLVPLAVVDVPEKGAFAVVSGDLGVLPEGDHIFRVTILQGGCELDLLKVTRGSTAVEGINADRVYTVYSLAGIPLGEIQTADDETLDSELYRLTGQGGMYIVKCASDGTTERRMVTVE